MYATLVGGRVFSIVICFMLLEGLLLTWYALRTGRGIAPLDLLPNLCAGMGLLAAAAFAMSAAGVGWIGLSLTLALLAHLLDVVRRWRGGESIQGSFSDAGSHSTRW